ncbi:MAG: hypothetical protein V1918_08180 [Planctomycetota bacterium]
MGAHKANPGQAPRFDPGKGSGQAISEYLLLVTGIMIGMGAAVSVLLNGADLAGVHIGGVREFYLNLIKVVSLPFP